MYDNLTTVLKYIEDHLYDDISLDSEGQLSIRNKKVSINDKYMLTWIKSCDIVVL